MSDRDPRSDQRLVVIDVPIWGPRRSKLHATEQAPTTSTILHFPQRPTSAAPPVAPAPESPAPMNRDQIKAKIVASMTADEKHQCRMLNVSPEAWAEQRLSEVESGDANTATGERRK